MRAPKGVTFLTQILWGSIGYSVGAALGAALAGKDENRRVFVLVGDGSFQVSRESYPLRRSILSSGRENLDEILKY
jgi:pyruvate decarboxylase